VDDTGIRKKGARGADWTRGHEDKERVARGADWTRGHEDKERGRGAEKRGSCPEIG